MKGIDHNIFKAYDIRGVYPGEINEKTSEILGRAITIFLKRKKKGRLNIVIGRDSRASSISLFSALKKGILREGANVIDIGLATTPMFYFSVWRYNFDGGVMVSASHNPPQYNGLKIVREEANVIGKNTGLEEIKKIALKIKQETEEKKDGIIRKKGKIKKKSVLKEYINFNFQNIDTKRMEKLKVIIDTGNAVPGILIGSLKKRVSFKLYPLFQELDSSFPNHLPNPLEEKNIRELKRAVIREKADLGVAFDGDGDRIVFVNEKGKTIPSDFITCLIAKKILKEEKGGVIVYNICSSNIIKEVVKESGGKAVVWKVGHTFVKQKMKATNAVFAGEYSGHFYFRKHCFCEAPLLVLFSVIDEIKKSEKTISELIKPFQKYFHSGQINLRVKNKKEKLKELEKRFKKGKISRLDGLRISFSDWWFCVRLSNTENLLRLSVEACDRNLMRKKVKEIINILKN